MYPPMFEIFEAPGPFGQDDTGPEVVYNCFCFTFYMEP